MKQLTIINPESVTEEEVINYKTRESSRAVVFDKEDKIALLYVAEGDYYKLPGGGIEEGEDKAIALKRECLEEIGCNVEVVNEIGIVVEYRGFSKLKQISYCYLAKVVGEKGKPNFDEKELSRGFKEVWMTKEEAKEVLGTCDTKIFAAKNYLVARDLAILEVCCF